MTRNRVKPRGSQALPNPFYALASPRCGSVKSLTMRDYCG